MKIIMTIMLQTKNAKKTGAIVLSLLELSHLEH